MYATAQPHYVQLINDTDPNIPSCDCVDWKRHCLPCKHLLAVLMHSEQCSGWDSLPEFYRNVPQFNLDPSIVQSAPQRAGDATADSSYVRIAEEDGDLPSDDIEVQDSDSHSVGDVTEPSVSSLQSQLRQTLSRITGLTYTISNVAFMKTALDSLKEHAKEFATHSDKRQSAVLFRRGRRIVQRSIQRSRLQRRLSAIRAKRMAKRKRQQLKKSRAHGKHLCPIFVLFVVALILQNVQWQIF